MQSFLQSVSYNARSLHLKGLPSGLLLVNGTFDESIQHRSMRHHIKKDEHNHYSVLGLTPKASKNQIKAAYYRLSKKYHPDLNKSPDAKRLFTEVSEAYEVLGHDARRRTYDTSSFTVSDPLAGVSHEVSKNWELTYDQFLKRHGKFRVRKPAMRGKSHVYNFDKFYKEHYNTVREDQSRKDRVRHTSSTKQDTELHNHFKLYSVLLFLAVAVVGISYFDR